MKVEIPQELGWITEIFEVPGTDRKLIFLEEAFTEEVERNLAKIVEYLHLNYSIKSIFVEGGWGDVSLSYMRKLSDKKKRKEVGENYLSRGLISGEEFLDITSDYPISLIGVDNEELYKKSYDILFSVEPSLPRLIEIIDKLKDYVKDIRRKIEDPTLEIDFVKEKDIGFRMFHNYLSGKILKVGINIALQYPNYCRLIMSHEQDPSLFSKASNSGELDRIECEVRERMLFGNDEQMRAYKTYRNLELLAKIAQIRLIPQEFELFKYHREEFTSESIRTFLNSYSITVSEKDLELIDTSVSKGETFYEIAEKRQKCFLDTSLKGLSSGEVGILIAGGYNTHFVRRLTKQKNVSYTSIMIKGVI